MKRLSVDRARRLRVSQTDAGQLLWHHLRNRRLQGWKFRRQNEIGLYVVDFVCPDAGLIVELDGGQHGDQLIYDEARTKKLGEQGYRVLRFWNNDVLKNVQGVLEVIQEALARPAPHHRKGGNAPTLSPKGRGSSVDGDLRVSTNINPRLTQVFRFVRCSYANGVAELVYAFDHGEELIERVRFPHAPALPSSHQAAFDQALKLLHLIAGVSYYKAGVPPRIDVADGPLDDATANLLDELYLHGLAEFAYRNGLDLRGRINFPRLGAGSEKASSRGGSTQPEAKALGLPHRTLVPIGGGKDSLVAVEAIKSIGGEATAVWVGNSPLIAACAERTGLPTLNIQRELAPGLFELNRLGAWNGHIPVTAVNSAILAVAAILYGFDSIAFANERSASAATLEYEGQQVNHQWSKGYAFERLLGDWLHQHVASDLDYFSLLRPFSELAVTRAFAKLTPYFDVFSSCNRNFKILGPKPADRWCGQCPKCHFVFLALAPFLPKPRLLSIFGRNLLDDENLAPGFDALLEYQDHKPFECVGEGAEARAAMYALSQRSEWQEDALVARFIREILSQLDVKELALEPWLQPSTEQRIAKRVLPALAFFA